jgi:glyoxylase-like metal-dependent hydrolase (beta-lactamase superfamily II)
MTEEIYANIFKVEIPLPKNPLKVVNSYFIISKDRNLIIDTGMKHKLCKDAMYEAIKSHNIDLNKTDFFITHLHADHMGLVKYLASESSVIYFNEPDRALLEMDHFFDEMAKFTKVSGFDMESAKQAFKDHPGAKYSPKTYPDFKITKKNQTINIGDYSLKCIETPGHTKGHTCLFEPEKKLIFSGDHILGSITPNISLWSLDDNPLNDYFNSLEKIKKLDIELVLPGHRLVFKDCNKRINELLYHHEKRLDEVLNIIKQGEKTPFETAANMSWDIDCKSWDLFPVMQKWFATSEAFAHLKHLEYLKKIKRTIRDSTIFYYC